LPNKLALKKLSIKSLAFLSTVQVVLREGQSYGSNLRIRFTSPQQNTFVPKQEDLEQGKAQVLVGCEVAAKVGELDCVSTVSLLNTD
jgi:hypothetical protein